MQVSTQSHYGTIQDSRPISKTSWDFKNSDQGNKFCGNRLMQYNASKPDITCLFHTQNFGNSGIRRLNSVTNGFREASTNKFASNECLLLENSKKRRPVQKKDNADEPVVIINQLNSDIDVKNIVDEILYSQKFPQDSSLYVLVSNSDENLFAVRDLNSTKCIQLSKNINKWNKANGKLHWPQTEISDPQNLKVSAKGRNFLLERLMTEEPYLNNIELAKDLFKYIIGVPQGATKNKLCQITTPNETVGITFRNLKNMPTLMVSTDTTEDRPCCCVPAANKPIPTNKHLQDNCVDNVMSQLVFGTPNLMPQGLTTYLDGNMDCQSKYIKMFKKRELRIPGNPEPISVSTCHITPCSTRRDCHSTRKDLKKLGHMSQKEFQGSLEQPCNCSPDQIRQLFELMEANKLRNMKSIACGENMNITTPVTNCTPESKTDRKRGYFSKLKWKDDKKIKCPKKKNVTTKHLCACEEHQKSIAKPEMKSGMRSYGCQSVLKDTFIMTGPYGEEIPILGQTAPSTPETTGGLVNVAIQDGPGFIKCALGLPCLSGNTAYSINRPTNPMGFYGWPNLESEIGLVEVLGPVGGYAAIGSGGTYTQAGNRQVRFSTAVGPGKTFNQVGVENVSNVKKKKDKKHKQKSKITCDCAKNNTAIVVATASKTDPILEHIHEADYDYDDTAWLDPKLLAQLRSDLCQTTSGFKLDKKPKPVTEPEPEVEVSLEDAIRYYASLHPEILADLFPPFKEQDTARIKDEKETNTKVNCECPLIPLNITIPQPTTEPKPNVVLNSEESEEEDQPTIFRGLRLSIRGKGSASKGLTGILTFR